MKKFSAAAERNRPVIIETFRPHLPASGDALEIASGSGQHIVGFAEAFSDLDWQPSDPSFEALASIEAYRAEYSGQNLKAPIELDVLKAWPVHHADVVVNINMIHISPWSTTSALFRGASNILAAEAPLILYGPFKRNGQHTAPNNRDFDDWLRERDPSYGVRDLGDVCDIALENGFAAQQIVPMPANNLTVIFRRQ
ncbi:MAG: DUF938 domain-containing protein [Myxococcota bacterium]